MARILVADDSASLLEIFGHVLKIKGHEVLTANCRDCLFKELYSKAADVIFLDVRLINEDGRDLCLAIHDGPFKNVPVVLMSATPQLLEDYEKFGATAILEKPFDIRQILEMVVKCLPTQFAA